MSLGLSAHVYLVGIVLLHPLVVANIHVEAPREACSHCKVVHVSLKPVELRPVEERVRH